ncbi:hypothetical protein LOTGIDRAFT_228067 [Lottia gigantea]|uniref:UBA domain-containing protein n=1 Tax=Lottia gigantea TaxID=225164 RepID=V4BCR7_LOTGI|nr:hypothetical protein LOTGIDRAFT_228067 [Lottia gigantea]ESP05516.1 hypothetical protein LOTGIDRAFT_228067 [Lottia gigantea]
MSTTVGTSRATNIRSTKDKLASKQMTQSTNRQNDGGGTPTIPKDKYQPTQEQLNIAHLTTNSKDDELIKKKINQLVEMTGKNEEQVAVALLDCGDDVERAALLLLEGGESNEQGEWKSQGKKKKPKNATPLPPPQKNDHAQNHSSEKPEYKRDRSRDRDQDSSDRYDGSSRRGRSNRNGAPPPRFARGRGRDRNFYGGDRSNENGEDNRENGFDNRDRSGGRGRGRGGFGRRGRGRGGRGGGSGDFGGEFNSTSNDKSPKFDKGPQIDTWTNETAEIQQKEPAGWGSTWGAEDWNEDSWTGNLNETQVFTSSRTQEEQPSSTQQNDTSSIVGQRLDLGMLLQKPNEIQQQPKQQSFNSMSQFNQQATESIKNCIGIGASRPSNLQTSQSLGPVGSLSQSVQSNSIQSPSSQTGQSTLAGQQALQQRQAKIQRSKLPPPSKIPASAVEMPGHRMPMLDVQFGVDFGSNNESAATTLSFGGADSTVTRLPTSVTNSPPSLNNHLPMNTANNTADSITSAIMASPSAGSSAGVISGLDQSSRSTSLFQSSAYSSPPKNESQSVLTQNKMSPPESIPFPSEHKSSPLVNQRTVQPSANSIGQGSLSNSQDSASLSSTFGQSAGSYQSGSYQGHKSSNLPGSQSSYTHTTNSQSSSYQSPYQSSQNQYQSSSSQYQSSQNQFGQTSSQTPYQSSQNQYQSSSGQNQYQSGQNQFPSGQQSYSNYQSGSSFQSQSGYSPNQSNTSSLYQNSAQASGAYPGQSSNQSGGAYPGQNSSTGSGAYSGQSSTQGSGSYSGSSASQNTGSYSAQNAAQSGSYAGQSASQSSGAYPGQGAAQTSGAYSGQSASQGSGAYSGQRETQSGSAYSGQSSSYHMRDSQSSNSANTNQYQTQSPGLATSPAPNQTAFSAQTCQSFNVQPSQTQTGYSSQAGPSQSNYSAQSFSGSSTLQTSPLTTSKLGDSLTKMTLKDSSMDSHVTNQYDHSSTSTPSLAATTSTPSLSGVSVNSVSSTSISAVTTTASSRMSSMSSNTSKAPPNLPPGVPLVGTPQYIMGQAGAVPSFYSPQQFYGYEDQMQLLQQRVPLANNYYDMTAAATYQVPSSLSTAGRDQASLVTSDSSKLNRVEAQSPNPSTQQQTGQSAHQPFFYGYYYPQVLPGNGFQIPTMYPMPAVTNTPHASTTATTQFQKTFGSHGYGTKAYDELSQVPDFTKTAYGVTPSQTKVTAGTRSGELAGSSYTKSHSQAFDKQGFHAGTPPPFLPHGTANQTGPLGTPTNPYAATGPFVQMVTPHNQLLHQIHQDSSVSNRMSQQSSSHTKSGGSKGYGSGAYWGAS